MNPAKIALIDPLTLLGRQVLELLPRFPGLAGNVSLFNTGPEGDHQVAQLGGAAALVPPLAAADDLEGCRAVLVASEASGERLETLLEALDAMPDVALVDAARLDALRPLAEPAAGPDPARPGRRLRVVHPALASAARVLRPLAGLGPVRLALTALEPVSELGEDAVDALARQATARLRGEPPEDDIAGRVLAFNCIGLAPDPLQEDAAALFPGLAVTVSRLMAGWFHGHLAAMTVTFAEPVDEGELLEAWASDPGIEIAPGPLRLDAVADSETVLLAGPQSSADRRSVAVTTAVDGLIVGGALTALELLQSLI